MEKFYQKTHEWASFEKTVATIGISAYAVKELGDIVFVSLPEVGDTVKVGTPFAEVESVKAVSEIYSPVEGVIAEVNDELIDNPAAVNAAAGEAWFIKVDYTKIGALVSEAEYDAMEKE
ncbi:MAG TPA: glycine cleavage system protein GcvH [Eubacteriales bacterium]|jgi:glycine cleavage system H protein|nr:glycine cleavage system protein GcvH [Clostridia bacterium]HRR89271.1 glycine cleavage system protein GcvH [Eubacteriales bacterium]HRU84062.1 glycine cleavage system protein GcvH [Eubacteriales bacterium]